MRHALPLTILNTGSNPASTAFQNPRGPRQSSLIHKEHFRTREDPDCKLSSKFSEYTPKQQEEQAQLKKDLFVPATDSIDIAKDMVNRLEQEQKLAQEKLRKAHEQLVMTLKGELEQVRIQHEPSTPNLSLKLARGGLELVRIA